MRREQTFGTRGARTFLLTGVLACLCFSSGEGLRLMPIPSTTLHESGPPRVAAPAATLYVSQGYQYATCGLEKSGQKRVKRQHLRDGVPVSPSRFGPLPVTSRPAAAESTSYRTPSPTPLPLGRAPPPA